MDTPGCRHIERRGRLFVWTKTADKILTPSDARSPRSDPLGQVLEPDDGGISPAMSEVTGQGDRGEPSTGELVRRLSEPIPQLVRDELRLALAELRQKASEPGSAPGSSAPVG